MGIFLVVAGILLLAASGMLWRRSAPNLAKMAATSATFEDSLKRVHAKLIHESLNARALTESQSSIPDTLKMYGAGKMMEMSNVHNKNIRKFEMQERDIKLELTSLKRDSEREREAARARVLPLGAAAVVALLAGIVLTALPARRVGA
jgi:hypothetical protein